MGPTHCTRQKRFRWVPFGDEDYNSDDEGEASDQKMPVRSYRAKLLETGEDHEADEWGPCRQKRKLDLTASEREKSLVPAYPDPCGPLTTYEEDLEPLFVALYATKGGPSDQEEEGERESFATSHSRRYGRLSKSSLIFLIATLTWILSPTTPMSYFK